MTVHDALAVFAVAVSGYFVLWNLSQMAMGPVASWFLWRHRQRYTALARRLTYRLASPPLVSIVVPSFNESLTIVQSVRALLALDYEEREIVVVNDGSSDDTLVVLQQTFDLLPAPVAFPRPLASAPIRGIYRSASEPALLVVDKPNGGSKADAVNAGINAASGSLILVIDADTVLAPDAVSRAVLPFLEDPDVVAVGGKIAIANGCRIEGGRIMEVGLPRSWLARFQVVEYTRAFLLFRLACAACNGVVLVSGAFGLFRRDALLAAGGFDGTAIGEDMDLTLRLQRHYRAQGRRIRIAFDPHPLGWTQVPDDWTSLRAQRLRWRRGLLQVLSRQRRMIGNPRGGVVGLLVLPYIAVFEGLAPLLEVSGLAVTAGAALLGLVNWHYFLVMLVVSILFGTAATLLSILLRDVATRRYMRGRELFLLVAVVLLEGLGYRQLNAWWGCVGTVQAMRGKRGWGVMKRRAFES